MKSRQQDLRCRSCCLHNAGKHLPVKTARKGALHEKSSSPARAAFFRGLDWRGASMLHRAAIPLCNTARRQLPGVRWRCCVTSKFDIFCHLSIFFLTPGQNLDDFPACEKSLSPPGDPAGTEGRGRRDEEVLRGKRKKNEKVFGENLEEAKSGISPGGCRRSSCRNPASCRASDRSNRHCRHCCRWCCPPCQSRWSGAARQRSAPW